ncbi:MAG TPA: V-type ATP synthase subunit E family protein [Ruminococcus sp.]|nr:V-type ATP synthase subunit E family protein [Ruminococcus sp.]
MSGLDEILNIIDEQRIQNEESIIGAANQKAAAIRSEGEQKAQKAYSEQLEKGQTDAKRDFVNACASVDSDMKRKVLDSKVKLIDSAIEATLERLAKLPEDEYFAMLKRLAEQKLRKGSGLISLSANDLKRLPADFETDIRSSAEKLGGTLEISKKPADISDGFILSYGLISENCSFRAIIESERDEVRDTAAAKLFG